MSSEKRAAGVVVGIADAAASIHSSRAEAAATPETPRPRSFRQRLSSLFEGWYYGWEVFGIAASGSAVVAIAILVWHFDGRPTPRWSARVYGTDRTFTLTLNSLLSIISTFGSTCAMIPVTKGLGQLKYLWFLDKDRTLADLETFDSASRGKVGSAQLLWRLRFKHLAVLGALASLLALAYGPFIQNLVVTEIDYREGAADAQLAFSREYRYNSGKNMAIDSAMKSTINAAVLDAADGQGMVPPNICRTGSCDWTEYYTVAACSRCVSIADKLTRTCTPAVGETEGGCDVTLSNGFGLRTGAGVNPRGVVMAMNTTGKPYVFDNYTNPFAIVQSIMAFDPRRYPANRTLSSVDIYEVTQDSVLRAHECAIVPCVQKQSFGLIKPEKNKTKPEFDPEAEKSIPYFYVHEEWDRVDISGSPDIFIKVDAAEAAGTLYVGGGFAINLESFNVVKSYLATILRGYVTKSLEDHSLLSAHTDPVNQDNATDSTFTALGTIFDRSVRGAWTNPDCDWADESAGDVSCGMVNVAQGITNGMRTAKWQEISITPPVFVSGLTWIPTEICYTQWQYISAPLAVWLLGLALVVGTILKTRRARLRAWRTSPLAMLLLSLDADGISHLQDWQQMGDAQLKDVSANLRIRLEVDDDGIRFVNPGKADSGGVV